VILVVDKILSVLIGLNYFSALMHESPIQSAAAYCVCIDYYFLPTR
jgi:hypothetical protein